MEDPTTTVLLLLALAGLTAGFVDAVVGGGGLIQLPALLLGLPQAAPGWCPGGEGRSPAGGTSETPHGATRTSGIRHLGRKLHLERCAGG